MTKKSLIPYIKFIKNIEKEYLTIEKYLPEKDDYDDYYLREKSLDVINLNNNFNVNLYKSRGKIIEYLNISKLKRNNFPAIEEKIHNASLNKIIDSLSKLEKKLEKSLELLGCENILYQTLHTLAYHKIK